MNTLSVVDDPTPVEVAEFLEFLLKHKKTWEPQAIPYLKQKFGFSYERAKQEWDCWVASISSVKVFADFEFPAPKMLEG